MKSPMAHAPRQFLHDGRCLCLQLLWGIFVPYRLPADTAVVRFCSHHDEGTWLRTGAGFKGEPQKAADVHDPFPKHRRRPLQVPRWARPRPSPACRPACVDGPPGQSAVGGWMFGMAESLHSFQCETSEFP